MGPFTKLALMAARTNRPGADPAGEGRRAMAELAPEIARWARRVRARRAALPVQAARDFVDMAVGHVWSRILKFEDWYFNRLPDEARDDGQSDWFPAWGRATLENLYTDLVRQRAREQAREQRRRDLRDAGLDHTDQPAAAADDEPGPFVLSADQMEQVRGWDPLDGVIAFTLGGQWAVVPPDLGRQWLAALGVQHTFPAAALRAAPRNKRRGMLAAALGIGRNALDQRWSRFCRTYAGRRLRPRRRPAGEGGLVTDR